MNPRDLPKVAAELIIELQEVHQHTDCLIEAFGRSLPPFTNRVLDHKDWLNTIEKSQ